MTALGIDGGFNDTDPLRDFFEAAYLPREQDPRVVARCPEVIAQAAAICAMDADSITGADQFGLGTLDLTIADIEYRVSPGVRGLITLNTPDPPTLLKSPAKAPGRRPGAAVQELTGSTSIAFYSGLGLSVW